ncbi:MAG: phosphoadenylyl-sulfate reductase [Bacteroidetes bacterium HGW-Bacteroidetes-21]|jgi:phosphoadenosine phosphosulfate reductase|nr:MAG: phosphoadenylyl-sulfate reductase [Bacteroidetes bacterium HGW-Bacteroidetes-21]
MTIPEIERQIGLYNHQGRRMFITSSFQTQSVVLLHIMSKIDARIPVIFLNTGYLFSETIEYKDTIVSQLGIDVIDLKPLVSKNLQRDNNGNLFFTSDPDYCCYLNKVQPLDPILAEYDVWINGVRADQSNTRAELKTEDFAPHKVVRFHPMLDWTKQMVWSYIKENNLPKHPLDEKGYASVGCEPCTRKLVLGDDERTGRWFGMKKNECGLNTDLIVKIK